MDGLRSDHTCLLYQDENEQKGFVLPFVQEGLNAGEHCLFVCPEAAVDDWSIEFQAFGIDVIEAQRTGALVIATGGGWRRSPFSSIIKARELWEHIDAMLAEFPAVRIAGDASWALIDPKIASDRLCHWEATADFLYEGLPVKSVCMYDLRLHSPSDILAALRTHGDFVLEERLFRNPYYEASQVLETEDDLEMPPLDANGLEAMLGPFRNRARS